MTRVVSLCLGELKLTLGLLLMLLDCAVLVIASLGVHLRLCLVVSWVLLSLTLPCRPRLHELVTLVTVLGLVLCWTSRVILNWFIPTLNSLTPPVTSLGAEIALVLTLEDGVLLVCLGLDVLACVGALADDVVVALGLLVTLVVRLAWLVTVTILLVAIRRPLLPAITAMGSMLSSSLTPLWCCLWLRLVVCLGCFLSAFLVLRTLEIRWVVLLDSSLIAFLGTLRLLVSDAKMTRGLRFALRLGPALVALEALVVAALGALAVAPKELYELGSLKTFLWRSSSLALAVLGFLRITFLLLN